MPVLAYPYETQDTTETQYTRILRETQDDGVSDVPGGPALLPSAPGGGMTLRVANGFAWARGVVLEVTGGAEVITVDPAGSQARVDAIVARLDAVNNVGVLDTVMGTPGAGLPALTRTDNVWEVLLGSVTVGAAATQIVQANVTDLRQFVSGRIGLWRNTTRPGMNGTAVPRQYQIGVNVTTGLMEFWDGAAYQNLGKMLRLVDLVLPDYDTLRGKTLHDGDLPPAAALGRVGDWYGEW